MVREIRLMPYLPLFVQEYREIGAILPAEEPELQLLADETELLRDNQFIITCNEIGIARFESILKILPDSLDSLEMRIKRVLIRWNDTFPYTYRALLIKLTELCGEGNFEVIPKFNDYEMEVRAYLPLRGQVAELEYLLGYMVPANIGWSSYNEYQLEFQGVVHTGIGVVYISIYELATDFEKVYQAVAESYTGLGMTTVTTIEID